MDRSDPIKAKWIARGDGYRPRTRHLDDQGRPIYTNRLFLESSPYLLQHAHNPVEWYPWGDDAFEAARRLDRPVLLSVGYSTCHWCHVMEGESFEDEAIARYINDHYLAVKVDREERPDVDAVYMSAVQAISGRGGWPMTVWLTPEREPFFGGTYFPARDGDRGSSVGFLTLLKKIRQAWDQRRDQVVQSAGELSTVVRQMLVPADGGALPTGSAAARAVAAAKDRFDARYGGIAGAPKFPSSLPLRLLLRHYRRMADREARDMAVLTLEKMAAGGMNDQVGGGFHRYSTDRQWLVPHFEKMLCDNALLVPAYIEGWQVTANERFRQTACATLDYVGREMTAAEGAFFSATDADTLAPSGQPEEGYYFTWTRDELEAVLGPGDAAIAATVYGVTAGGNYEGRNVLHWAHRLDAAANELKMPLGDLAAAIRRINALLYQQRQKRPAPLRDEKILAAWNGLMISAFARAGFACDNPGYILRAAKAADFILANLVAGGRLARSHKDGAAGGGGYLEDYAFFTAGLLDLFSVTADIRWLDQALALDRVLADRFEDREKGGFFMTADDHEMMIARAKPCFDGALPSGNAVALNNLLRLYDLTLDPSYHQRAKKGLTAFSAVLETEASALAEMAAVADDFLHPPPQFIAVLPSTADGVSFGARLRRAFLPGSLVMLATPSQVARLSGQTAVLAGKTALGGGAAVYVCRQGACEAPITAVDALQRRLMAVAG